MYQRTSEFSLNFDVFHTRSTEIAPASPFCLSTKPHWNNLIAYLLWARGGAVGWGTALQAGKPQVRFPMVSLESLMDINLSIAS
jgi:hypothetical protein